MRRPPCEGVEVRVQGPGIRVRGSMNTLALKAMRCIMKHPGTALEVH